MLNFRKVLLSSFTIALAALGLRLMYLLHFFLAQPPIAADHYFPLYEVVCVAKSIADGHGFGSPLHTPSGPTAMVTPVYTYILALIFKIFGGYSLRASVAIRVFDVVLSSLTCFPLIALARRLFDQKTAALAGWIWAALPSSIFHSVVWIWDTSLSVLVLTVALCMTYLVAEKDDTASWGGLGLLWGFGTLVNSALLPVFPGCLAFAVYRAKQRGLSWLKAGAATLVLFVVALSPWVVRNEIVFQGRVLLRSNFGLELWLGNNPEVPISCACWLHPGHDSKELERYVQLGEVAYMQEKQSLATQFMLNHPAATVGHIYHRFMETWTGFGDPFADIWATQLPLLRATLILNYSVTIFALAGLLLARRALRLDSLPLLNLMVIFPMVYYICHTDPRYRQPIEPVIAMLTAFALTQTLNAIRLLFYPVAKVTEGNARQEIATFRRPS